MGSLFGRLAEAYLFTNQYEKAERYARDAIRQPSAQYVWTSHVKLISALGHLQKHEEAKQAVQNLLAFMPGITCRFVRRHDHMAADQYIDDFIEGLRLEGLPE